MKEDLIRLAHLVHVDVLPTDTVAILQGKVRPMVAEIMGKSKPASKAAAPPAKAATKSKAKAPPLSGSPGPAASSVSEESMTSAWSMVAPAELQNMETRLQTMMAGQEERYQAMLNQVMQHVMAMAPSPMISQGSVDQPDEMM